MIKFVVPPELIPFLPANFNSLELKVILEELDKLTRFSLAPRIDKFEKDILLMAGLISIT